EFLRHAWTARTTGGVVRATGGNGRGAGGGLDRQSRSASTSLTMPPRISGCCPGRSLSIASKSAWSHTALAPITTPLTRRTILTNTANGPSIVSRMHSSSAHSSVQRHAPLWQTAAAITGAVSEIDLSIPDDRSSRCQLIAHERSVYSQGVYK